MPEDAALAAALEFLQRSEEQNDSSLTPIPLTAMSEQQTTSSIDFEGVDPYILERAGAMLMDSLPIQAAASEGSSERNNDHLIQKLLSAPFNELEAQQLMATVEGRQRQQQQQQEKQQRQQLQAQLLQQQQQQAALPQIVQKHYFTVSMDGKFYQLEYRSACVSPVSTQRFYPGSHKDSDRL